MPCVPSKGLGELDERGLEGLLDMYESAISELYVSGGRETDELVARLTRRRAEVIDALTERQKHDNS